MRAMILAAGLGTRLRPLTDIIPKPLMPVVGVPNIVRLIDHLARFGVRELVVNLHHLADAIPALLGDGSSLGVRIAYSREPEILGTGGGIRKALELLGDETFLVVNGDAVFAPDLARAVALHRSSGALATLVVRETPEADAYGAIGVDREGRVRGILSGGEGLARTMFTGVHVLEPAIGKRLPENGCIVRATYMPLLAAGAPLFAAVDAGYFCDLGTPRRFLETNLDLVHGRARLPGLEPPPDGVHVGRDVAIGAGVVLGSGAIVCDGARLAPGVRVEESVVMEGAAVDADASGCVVMPGGSVVRPERV
jgi:mannose-1-phosphate guanylyltransferase